MELLNKLNSNIDNYFIDNDIDIKEDDDTQIKYKKYLLKYKRIIALICLIILLIIGYYYNPFNIENKNSINNKSIQKGGSNEQLKNIVSVTTPATTPAATTPSTTPAATTPSTTPSTTPAATTPADGKPSAAAALDAPASKKLGYFEKKGLKSKAKLSIKADKIKEAKDKAKESLKKGAKKLVSPSAYYDAGAAAAHKFKDNAGVIYQILYSVALFIVLCVITVPAMAFAIIGIMCFFLLKDKMKTIKGL